MEGKTYSVPKVFLAACAGMVFFGIAMLSLGPILGKLGHIVDGANQLPATMSIGILIGTVLFGPIVDRAGYKWPLIISTLLALLGLPGPANFASMPLLHGSIFCLGLGGGVLNGLTNALVSDIYDDDKRGGKLGLLGACYCIGALLWTLLNYFISDFRIPLYAMAAIMAGFIIFFICNEFPKAKPAENTSWKATFGLLKYPALLLFGLVLFFQSGFEGASGNFTISFLENGAGMEGSKATLALTWFTIGMLAGRLPLGDIMKKLGNISTLYLYMVVGLIGVGLFYFFRGNVVLVWLAMALIGFGVGATFPVILNFIGGAFRELSGTAFSIAIFIALLGQSLCNKLTGVAFDKGEYNFLPALLCVALVCIMILTPLALGVAVAGKRKK